VGNLPADGSRPPITRLRIQGVEFVTSAAGLPDLPSDRTPEVALVGRSNVGKSTLINALVGQAVARVSASPGKTRLVNVYRVRVAGGRALYLMDLPGYGYARGGSQAAHTFERLTEAYFSRQSTVGSPQSVDSRQATVDSRQAVDGREATAQSPRSAAGARRAGSSGRNRGFQTAGSPIAGAILTVDSRHPGLPNDAAAYAWLRALGLPLAIVATKVDKLTRAERTRSLRQLETTFEARVLPLSAVTGEGLDDLWKQMLSWIAPHGPAR